MGSLPAPLTSPLTSLLLLNATDLGSFSALFNHQVAHYFATKPKLSPLTSLLLLKATDLGSFSALVNQQVAHYFATQPKLLPFRDFLKKGASWYWDDKLQAQFDEAKNVISFEIRNAVTSFDPTKPTALLNDWCKSGIGYLLMEKHCNCESLIPNRRHGGWKVNMGGSRFTTTSESNYAPTEEERLAVVDSFHRTRYYTIACENLGISHRSKTTD